MRIKCELFQSWKSCSSVLKNSLSCSFVNFFPSFISFYSPDFIISLPFFVYFLSNFSQLLKSQAGLTIHPEARTQHGAGAALMDGAWALGCFPQAPRRRPSSPPLAVVCCFLLGLHLSQVAEVIGNLASAYILSSNRCWSTL